MTIVADYRSNSLIVKAGAANLALVEKLLNELDVVDSPAKNEVRVIPIRNAVASDLAITLQDAINGQLTNSGNGYKPQNQVPAGHKVLAERRIKSKPRPPAILRPNRAFAPPCSN